WINTDMRSDGAELANRGIHHLTIASEVGVVADLRFADAGVLADVRPGTERAFAYAGSFVDCRCFAKYLCGAHNQSTPEASGTSTANGAIVLLVPGFAR